MARGYQHKTTSVFLLKYHFVFCPKRRRKVLVNAVRDRLITLLNEKAIELGWQVIGLEVMPDHVHLFIGIAPSVAPDQVMFRLKGYTARVLRSEFSHLLKMPSLWTRSYFVSTAGNVSGATIERYIAQQTTRD
ncbi:MAG: IS200/IS605 family transposase [Pleurocapsa sp. SU_196_0]|nr:IS200/IS605 family transposase [Pleurocapsa sp. SU_196_0]